MVQERDAGTGVLRVKERIVGELSEIVTTSA